MRKLIMWNIISLDGYFEGPKNWALSFHDLIWGEELKTFSLEQLRSADYLVFGRVTYEGMAAYWPQAKGEIAVYMNKIPKLVFSGAMESAAWENTSVIRKDAAAEIGRIKTQGHGDIYVFGSARLSETLLEHKLFDEFRIAIAPVILGKGRPLFAQGVSSKNLSLISTQQLSTGGVILKFKARDLSS
jgi:dihydrofolate reductase